MTSATVERIVLHQRRMIYDVECVHCHEILLTTARIGDVGARIVVEHLATRHPGALDSPVDFDDPGLVEIFHHVRVTTR